MNLLHESGDFQDDLGLGAGLGDIPDNLIGSTNCNLRVDEANADEELSLGLSEMFAARGERNLHLLSNDERLVGIYSTADAEAQNEKWKNDTLQMAKLKATLGRDVNEVLQCLKQGYTDDEISNDPGIMDFLDKYFLWFFFLDDPCAFDSCDQAKAFLQKLGRKSMHVLSGPRCSGCRSNEHDRCSLLGKSLIKGLDFSPKIFDEISGALRMRGLIKSDVSVTSADEIKIALSPKKETSVRVYNAPKREKTHGISMDDAIARLHAQTVNKAIDERNQKIADFKNAKAKPAAQQILALIYKDAPSAEIQHLIESQLSPEDKKLSAMLYKEMNDDPLLKSGLVFPPIVFNSCPDAKSFLIKNGLKFSHIKSFEDCDNCNKKANGCCTLLGGKLLASNMKIAEHDRLAKIDELCVSRQITDGRAKQCRKLEKTNYLAGLREAQKLAGTKSDRNASSNDSNLNSLVEATAKFTDHNNALESAINQLSSGIPLSSVRTMLQSRMSMSAADSSIEEILYGLSSVRAEAIDDCTQASHQFKDGAVLVKAGRCTLCQYASDMGCSKTKLAFGTGELPRIADAEQTREGREILDIFNDPDRIIDAEPYSQITGIQVDLNPDSGQMYELGKLENTELPDMSVPDMVVDVNPRISAEQGLEIEDLGSADGWDIGSCL
jgi:hypothetical protein